MLSQRLQHILLIYNVQTRTTPVHCWLVIKTKQQRKQRWGNKWPISEHKCHGHNNRHPHMHDYTRNLGSYSKWHPLIGPENMWKANVQSRCWTRYMIILDILGWTDNEWWSGIERQVNYDTGTTAAKTTIVSPAITFAERRQDSWHKNPLLAQQEQEHRCSTCMEFQQIHPKNKIILHEMASKPWGMLCTDIFALNHSHCLWIADYHSEFLVVKKSDGLSAEQCINAGGLYLLNMDYHAS